MSRPEKQNPPQLHYNETEARKYHSSSRVVAVQGEITARALELLALEPGQRALILDIGCGSGLSGEAIEEAGHVWVGCDISRDMLAVAAERESDAGDVLQRDMGQGLPFRPGVFDGAISISALQWLCYEDSKAQSARARLMRFFSSLYGVLKRGARAALQFYPENTDQVLLITECATRVGFQGGLVVDYPNSSKAKKYYLCLSFEHAYRVPKALGTGDGAGGVGVTERERAVQRGSKGKKKGKRAGVKSRDWILQKKDSQRRRGLEVRPDTKYTGRKRKEKF